MIPSPDAGDDAAGAEAAVSHRPDPPRLRAESAVVSAPPRCRATTVAGARCQIASDLSPEGFCLWHDPMRTTEAQFGLAEAAGHGDEDIAAVHYAVKSS